MSFQVSRTLLYSAIGMAIAGQVQAAALKLELFIDGKPAGQTDVLLNGETLGTSSASGKFWYDELPGGGHQLQLRIADQMVPYEFTIGASQAAVITVNAESASGRTVKSIQKLDLSELDGLDGTGAQLRSIAADDLAPGLIQGTVTTASGEQPLRNVTVKVVGGGQRTVTDRYGAFELELAPGVYQLQLEHPGYQASRLRELRVLPKLNLAVEVELTAVDAFAEGGTGGIEEVQVMGRYLPGNSIEIERVSSSVVDSIDFTQISRFDDSMVSSALKRVVGVSMEDDRFAIVRGMKGRYQSTELNGATLPSTDPARRDLPFDIFPAGIMQGLSLQKSATADVPLGATAGHISMRTKDIPEEAFFKISYSATRSDSHGDDMLMSSTQGDRDWLGMDDGSREMPDILRPTVDQFLNVKRNASAGFEPAEIEALGEAIPHNAIYYGEAKMDSSLSFNGGDSWDLGQQRLGLIGALRYANKWSSNTKDNSRFSAYENGSETLLILDSEAETLDTNNVIDLSAMLNLQWDITENHRLGLNNIALRHTTNSSELEKELSTSGLRNFRWDAVERLRNGEDSGLKTNPDAQRYWRQRVEWIEEQLVSHQLWGAHNLDISADSGWSLYLGDLGLEWQAMTANTEYDRPNATQYSYEANNSSEAYRFMNNAGDQYNIWETMQEDNEGYRLDLELPVEEIGGVSLLFKAGMNALQRDREGDVTRYYYVGTGSDGYTVSDGGIPDPRRFLVPENILGTTGDGRNGQLISIGAFSIEPEEDVGMVGDDYISELETSAQYALVEANILEKLKVNLGVRKETFKLDAELYAYTPEPLTNLMDKERTNPSLGLTWMFNDAWQLRAAWSETVNWPEVFEIIPREFNDIETLEKYKGNPELKPADIENVDLRLEWYPSDRESVTLALFRKELTNAIENRFLSTGQVYDKYTFDNAEQAEVEGVELDLRREFVLGRDQGHELFVQFNYTDITSSANVTEGSGGSFARQVERPLQGQPEYIANLQLGYDHVDTGQEVTLVFNQMGEELAIANSKGDLVGEVYRLPYSDLRLIYKKKFLNGLSLAASVDNLLDEEHNLEYADFNVPYLSYKSGRKFKLSASYEF